MLTATEIRATAIARGRAIKRVNAWTAVLCGGLPALTLGILFPAGPWKWLAGFVAGLLWAILFEYAYHRFLLHLPGTFFARRRAELDPPPLTARELAVLGIAAHGGTAAQLAAQLNVTPATVNVHLKHIYMKLGVTSRVGAVAHALRNGLVE